MADEQTHHRRHVPGAAALVLVFCCAVAVGLTVVAEVRIARAQGENVAGASARPSKAVLEKLMRQRPGAPTRIVPVFSWVGKASGPLVTDRDCVQDPAGCDNGRGGIDIAYAAPQSVPTTPVRATVLTDSGCEPDAAGASHCSNQVRLAGGKLVWLRNDHRLANEPCLSPGEHILLAPGPSAHTMLAKLRTLAADKSGAWPAKTGARYGLCKVSDSGLQRAGIDRSQLACAIS